MTEQTETMRLLDISGTFRAASLGTVSLRAVQARLTPDIELRLMALEGILLYNEDSDSRPALPAMAALRSSIAAVNRMMIDGYFRDGESLAFVGAEADRLRRQVLRLREPALK